MPLDTVRKILLKTPELWANMQKSASTRDHNKQFNFADFLKALKVLSRLGYKETKESDDMKFNLLCQYLRNNASLQKPTYDRSTNKTTTDSA